MKDFNFKFAIYNPIVDIVEVNIVSDIVLFILCTDFNATVIFPDANDVVYLYQLPNK
ncbi:hypothetical protein [Clostridium estertheticum]|uniref:Uncharacterized protein n=1 Tax=Clostridium estertheticum TaxID=238834 RepID=A0A7Y3WSV3_9CLOT|nr:hypothetical protein [Clostridium estertheticum]NNU76350.1 hypothetical protein [Clostridium estertheticum]WBL45841.1 hypothetical protein LOR37_14255 [Clostridium estertheticum]